MENKSTASSGLNSLNVTEKSITTSGDGKKSIEELIESGRQWADSMKAMGYQETPDGFLPISEIKKAGYVLDKNNQWAIPAEEFIADGNTDRKPGEKFIGPSSQYLNWRKQKKIRDSNRTNMSIETQLKFTKEEVDVPREVMSDDEINVDEIPF